MYLTIPMNQTAAATSYNIAQKSLSKEMTMVNMNYHAIKDLSLEFSRLFNNKDAAGIGTLLMDDFATYDPANKWVRGRKNLVNMLDKLFRETRHVKYEVLNAFQDGNVGVLEFKITLDDQILDGVDIMHWENGKMVELRCYYNPPA